METKINEVDGGGGCKMKEFVKFIFPCEVFIRTCFLKYPKLDHLPKTDIRHPTQFRFTFKNGYGASVINYGYGCEQGLFELAVLKNNKLCYDTTITNDVEGSLTIEKVNELLKRISKLKNGNEHKK